MSDLSGELWYLQYVAGDWRLNAESLFLGTGLDGRVFVHVGVLES